MGPTWPTMTTATLPLLPAVNAVEPVAELMGCPTPCCRRRSKPGEAGPGRRLSAHARSANFGVLAAVQLHEVGVVAALWLCDVGVLAAVQPDDAEAIPG